MSEHTFPDRNWLRDAAGEGAFKRGAGYFKSGAVSLSQVSRTALVGEAHGSEIYRLWFKRVGGDWRWSCECPAADLGALCKHLVAAVLTARADDDGDQPLEVVMPKPSRKKSAASAADLRAFLHAQPAARLADWLLALAQEDRDIEKRLLLLHAASKPGAMQDVLSKVLASSGFMDYRRTLDYARRLEIVIDQLGGVLQRDPAECRTLCEYALKRLFKVQQRMDDSAGAVGDCMAMMADLHAQACRSAPPGKTLVKPLWILHQQDDLGLLPLISYWDALGTQGQAAYARLAIDAFEGLSPVKPGRWDDAGAHICHLVEALASTTRDFPLLQRVLRRDLSSPRQHLRVLESLHEYGRAREALAFAETAVKRFPKDVALRDALAGCLVEAGLGEEALEQRWAAFIQQPDASTWDGLKQSAGVAWPEWREKALSFFAGKQAGLGIRILLLAHDGALADAVALARSERVENYVLHDLAKRLRAVDPPTAAEFYLRLAAPYLDRMYSPSQYKDLVALLAQSAKCVRSDALHAFVGQVRATHARKTKLMAMLDQAGL